MLSAIIAICLISIAFGYATRAAVLTTEATHRLLDRARFQVAISRLDDMAVRSASRIRQPVWLAMPQFRAGRDTLSIAYLDGDAGSDLSLSWNDERVTIAAGEKTVAVQGVEVTGAAVVTTPPAHLAISCTAEHGYQVTITAPFGLFPVPRL
jgi:hypothetical protein